MIDELQTLLANTPRFDSTNYKKLRPIAGLDIAFQKGETYTTADGQVMDRISSIVSKVWPSAKPFVMMV